MLEINRSTVFSITFQYFTAKPVAEIHICKEEIIFFFKVCLPASRNLQAYQAEEYPNFNLVSEYPLSPWRAPKVRDYFNTGVSESWFCNLTSLELWTDLFTRCLSFISGEMLTGQDCFLLVYHFLHQKYGFGIFPFSFNGNEEQTWLRCCQLSQFHHKPHYLCVFLKPQDSGWKKTKIFYFMGLSPGIQSKASVFFTCRQSMKNVRQLQFQGWKVPSQLWINHFSFSSSWLLHHLKSMGIMFLFSLSLQLAALQM